MASLVKTDKISKIAGGSQEFTLPGADGTAKSALITDGSGVLSFATGTPSSSNFLRGDGTWQTVTTTALTGSTNTWIPTITGANALTGTANFTYDGNTLDVKNSGTASSVKLYCESSNAHSQEIKAAPHAGSSSWTLTLPPTVPSVSGQALTATTAGVSTWATVGGSNSPAFLAETTGSTASWSNGTWTKIPNATEIFDTDSDYDTAAYRFTPSVAGKYYIYAQACYSANSSNLNQAHIMIYKNGSQFAMNNREFPLNPQMPVHYPQISQIIDFNGSSDYVEAWGYITVHSGAWQLVGNDGIERTWFGGFKLI